MATTYFEKMTREVASALAQACVAEALMIGGEALLGASKLALHGAEKFERSGSTN